MTRKNITIEDLARMVSKGFSEADKKTERGFNEVNNRLERIENTILKQHAQQIESLERRMNRLEEDLVIK